MNRQRHTPLPPQCDNCFLPYGKFGELSYMDSGVKRSSRQCRLADCTKEYCASGFCTMKRRLKIVEANAEHDFRLKRLIGMLRTTKRAQIFCAICQTPLPDRPFGTPILYSKKNRDCSLFLSLITKFFSLLCDFYVLIPSL